MHFINMIFFVYQKHNFYVNDSFIIINKFNFMKHVLSGWDYYQFFVHKDTRQHLTGHS